MRIATFFLLLAAAPSDFAQPGSIADLNGQPRDPFASPANAHVLIFVRTDCPITNRYAPELQRIAAQFARRSVDFWFVYPDASETASAIGGHQAAYQFPGTPIRDAAHQLVRRAQAKVAPEAAVFDASGHLTYSGRIDDRFVAWGKERRTPTTHDLADAIAKTLAGRPVSPAKTKAIGCFLADVK